MDEPFWVFGYGSLMWNPGFRHLFAVPATLLGAHRSLCVYSWHYRGTPERPGLVFGLDRGGACRGLAFAVDPGDRDDVVAYLRAREQVTSVYVEKFRQVRIAGHERSVQALTYVADRRHPQYTGRLTISEQLEIVKEAAGVAGPNPDYIRSTAEHLAALGIRDHAIEQLVAALRPPE